MYDSFVKEYYKNQGQNEHKTLEFGSYETILGCVKAGMGKSLLPLSIVEKLGYENDLKIIELDKKTANIPTCVVCRTDNIPKINEYLTNMEL